MSTSAPIELTVRGSQPSGSRSQRRSTQMKTSVTIVNWMTNGTTTPAIADQIDPPRMSETAPMIRVMARLIRRTVRYVGKSSGPISWPPKRTDRSSPR